MDRNCQCYRAVKTSQEELVKKIMKDKKHISDPYINWSADCAENCIDLAIRNGNVPMTQLLLKYKYKKFTEKPWKYQNGRVSLPKNPLKVGTGSIGIHTLGVKVRKVKAARGGKEGNNVCTFCFCFFHFIFFYFLSISISLHKKYWFCLVCCRHLHMMIGN